MIIDGKKLADCIVKHLAQQVNEGIKAGKPKPKLVVVAVKPSAESIQYMNIKKRRMEEIGGECVIKTYNSAIRFQEFVQKVSVQALKPDVSGILIQLPLPAGLGTMTLFNYIPPEKEIEGYSPKSTFTPPIGLAVLTMLKSVFLPIDFDVPESVICDLERDGDALRDLMRKKKIVIIGSGQTGGQPVGAVFTQARMGYININEKTPEPEDFLKQADIIISCVGKKVLSPENVKQGAVLISVGLHEEKKKWVGDYVDSEIEDIALAYSPTPGGVGPLNVAYLLSNVVEAWKQQPSS